MPAGCRTVAFHEALIKLQFDNVIWLQGKHHYDG